MSQSTFRFIPLHIRIAAGERMVNRKQTGEKVSDIAADLGVSRFQMYNIGKRYEEDQTMADRVRGGRPPKVTEQTRRRVIREFQKSFQACYYCS